MTRFGTFAVAPLAALLLAANSGCFLIKQTYYEARGAVGSVDTVGAAAAEGQFKRYRSVQFEPATTTLDEKLCPRKLLESYDDALVDYRKKMNETFPGGTPELRAASEVQYFQKKTLMGSAICIMRVKLRDSGGQVGDVLVHSESKAFRAGGERALARACARALLRHLGAQVPEEEKEEERDSRNEDKVD
jgi:hypothetical protein